MVLRSSQPLSFANYCFIFRKYFIPIWLMVIVVAIIFSIVELVP